MRVLPTVALILALLAPACGDDDKSPAAPSVPNVAGNWSGPVSDNYVGAGQLAMSVSQSGSALTGTWTSTYNTPGYNNGGALTGSINTSGSITATLTPAVPTSCPFNSTATVNGSQINGTYAAFNCSVVVAGTFSLTKR